MIRKLLLTAAGLSALVVSGCGQEAAKDNGASPAAAGSSGDTQNDSKLAQLLGADPRFAQLITAAGMTPVLEGKEPYTVLAPTAAALDALPAGSIERLTAPAARVELTGLLRRHILPGTILAGDLAKAVEGGGGKATVASLAGEPLTVTRDGEGFRIADSTGKGARLSGPERVASNGVIHSIDAVLPAAGGTRSETN